jgi:hypothetical protein
MIEWRLRAILNHPTARRHWERVMIYGERVRPWRSFPGVYVRMPKKSFDPRGQREWSYFRTPVLSTDAITPDLLYSCVGSPTHSSRDELFRLRHPDAVVEEVRDFMFWDSRSPGFHDR